MLYYYGKELKMNVIDVNNGLLTNSEVLQLLKERREQRNQYYANVPVQSQAASSVNNSSIITERQRIDSQHRLAIENKVRTSPLQRNSLIIFYFLQTFQYFQRKKFSDCSQEELSHYLLQMKEHSLPLTESEYIQLANLLPESDVEFYLVCDLSLALRNHS